MSHINNEYNMIGSQSLSGIVNVANQRARADFVPARTCHGPAGIDQIYLTLQILILQAGNLSIKKR